MVAKGERDGGELNWEFGTSTCKVFYTEWVSNKVLFYSTGNCTQRLMCVSRSVVSDSLQPHGLQPARHLCLWEKSGKKKKRQKVFFLTPFLGSSSTYLLLILSISSGICLD